MKYLEIISIVSYIIGSSALVSGAFLSVFLSALGSFDSNYLFEIAFGLFLAFIIVAIFTKALSKHTG